MCDHKTSSELLQHHVLRRGGLEGGVGKSDPKPTKFKATLVAILILMIIFVVILILMIIFVVILIFDDVYLNSSASCIAVPTNEKDDLGQHYHGCRRGCCCYACCC